MGTVRSLLILFVNVVICTGGLSAITPDELAAYLDVSSWHTAVDLPPNSYVVELHEFVDGKVRDASIISIPEFAQHPEVGLTIMSGKQDGKYRFVLKGWNGTYGTATEEVTFSHTIGSALPDKIKEGDFILFGEPLSGGASHASDDIHSFAKGFLLRIKKHG